MPTFKIVNKSSWEITPVDATTIAGAKRAFKELKGLNTFNDIQFDIYPPRSAKNYTQRSFSQFEQSQFYNRKK